jgi:hypothetical protein
MNRRMRNPQLQRNGGADRVSPRYNMRLYEFGVNETTLALKARVSSIPAVRPQNRAVS